MSYYILEEDFLSWRNHLIQAEVTDEAAVRLQEFFWKPEPIRPDFPEFTFKASPFAPKPDCFKTGTLISLYSHRLVAIIQNAGVLCETFPALLVDRKTNEPLEKQSHKVFHLMDVRLAFDDKRSDLDYETLAIHSIVLSDECLQEEPKLFREKRWPYVLIHSSLKRRFEEKEITGFHFTPIEDFHLDGFEWMVKKRYRPRLP